MSKLTIRHDALLYVATLTGDANTPMTWQVFDDDPVRKDKTLARVLHGRLEDVASALAAANDAGCGVFVTVNETDLQGRKAANILGVRALFIDCDTVRPTAWHLPPSVIVESKAGPHAYWLVCDGDLTTFSACQRRLIAHYHSDPVVNDLPRVMRLPGFDHRKGEPFTVRLGEAHADRGYSVADVMAGLREPAAPAPRGLRLVHSATATPQAGSDGYGRAALLSASVAVASAQPRTRNPTLFREAARLGQLVAGGALKPDDVEAELLRAADACGLEAGEATDVIRRALKYGESQPRQAPMSKAQSGKSRHHGNAEAGPKAIDANPVPTVGTTAVHFPDLDKDGKPYRDRQANTAALFAAYGIQVRYNRMTKGQEVACPVYVPITGREQNATLNWVQSVAADHGLSRNAVLSHIEADNHSYHPIEDWIESKPWDGVSRFDQVLSSLELAADVEPMLARTLLRRWAVSCAVAVWPSRPANFATQGVLILQGDQGAHKTRWIESLVPASLGAILTGHVLDPTDRDNVEIATSHWIVELGELDATFKNVAATPKPRRFAKTRTLRHTARNARKLIHPPSPQLSAQAKPRNGSRAASRAFALQEWVQRAWRARPFRRGKRAAARLKIGKRESSRRPRIWGHSRANC